MVEPGRRADLALIDPEALGAYDFDANTMFGFREAVAVEQMVNRSDGVVTNVWVAVKCAQEAKPTESLGKVTMARALTAI